MPIPARTTADDLLDQLRHLARASNEFGEGRMQWLLELSVAHALALRAVAASRGAFTPSDLARVLRCTRSNACQLLAGLERVHMIQRHRDPADGRRVALCITPRGVDVHVCAETELAEQAQIVFGQLDDAEKRELLALLQKVASSRYL
jgi:DNA-binding MarR family transcriptional regulator